MKHFTVLFLTLVCRAQFSGAQAATMVVPSGFTPSAVSHELAVRLVGALNQGTDQFLATFLDYGGPGDTPLAREIRRLSLAHVAKYAPRDSMVVISAREYERVFSEADLRALLSFFQTALGARSVLEQKELLWAIQATAGKTLSDHSAELNDAIRALIMNPPPQ